MVTINKDGTPRKKRCDAGVKRKEYVTFTIRLSKELYDYVQTEKGELSMLDFIRLTIKEHRKNNENS